VRSFIPETQFSTTTLKKIGDKICFLIKDDDIERPLIIDAISENKVIELQTRDAGVMHNSLGFSETKDILGYKINQNVGFGLRNTIVSLEFQN
jgi:hypothetical protein